MADPDAPNILLILTDDQRFDALGCLGRLAVQTPNLDRLVARGTRFSGAHIMGGTSPAVCMPSRAMLHSGRPLFHLDREGQAIPDEHATLGQTLAAHGYDTWACGKWHNGKPAFARSFTDGAEVFFGGMTDHWNVPAHDFDPTGAYDNQLPRCPEPARSNALQWTNADHVHAGLHSTDLLADAAARFLRSRSPNDAKPFFQYVSLLAPHDPRTMPQRYLDLYDPDRIELPPNFLPVHPFDNGELAIRDEQLAAMPRTEAETRRHLAEYCAMVSHLDDALGRVLDTLDAQGLADNTLVVFAGDNGLAVGQHGLMGKQSLYDHSVRVPLVFAGPGVAEGQTRRNLCYLHDLMPTLCDLLGLQAPDSVMGRSLAADLASDADGLADAAPDALLLAYRHLMRGLTTGSHKLIEYHVDGRRRTQLFDLEADPWEMHDLADDPAHADRLAAMREQLAAARRHDADPHPWT